MLLHGYLSSKEAFTAQTEYFSRFYRVTAIDFIGFGQSMALTSAFSVDDYAEWLKELLVLLSVRRPHVIAHSFGCRVAIKLASKYPELFDKLLLTGAAGVILKRGVKYRCKVKAYRLVKRLFPQLAEKRFGSAEYRTLSPVMKESYKKIVNEDLRECARKVENSVLLVQGEGDTVTPLKEVNEYLVCLKHAKLIQMSGGHFAFCEYPAAFNLIAEEYFYE